MQTMRWLQVISVIALAQSFVNPYATAQDRPDFHVKAVNILPLTFRGAPDDKVADLELQVTLDGSTYSPLGVGLPRHENLFRSVQNNEGQITVRVVVVGDLHCCQGMFFPEKAGLYKFRWVIRLNDVNKEPIVFDESLEFAQPTKSDLGFIQKVGEPPLLRRLFGQDYFERQGEGTKARLLSPQGADSRAVEVIARLIEGTRARAPGEVSTPGRNLAEALTWAESLWKLSQEFPESSYAPYAAYFAGAVYSSEIVGDDRARLDDRTTDEAPARAKALSKVRAFVRSHPSFEKADNALMFAAENADAYLKPQALFIRAEHQALARDWDAAEKLLHEALIAEPGGVTVNERVRKMREHMGQEKHHFEP